MVDGDEFRNTTTGQWFKYNGSGWQPMFVAGPWVAQTGFGTGITLPSTTYFALATSLLGTTVQFKGTLASSGALGSNATVLTLSPSSLWPAKQVVIPMWAPGTIGASIDSTGVVRVLNATSSGGTLAFDGLWYSLS
jgi:hypothetical protein